MNLFLIVLSLIFFHGNSISGADDNELEAIDVLSAIKTTSPDCDLRTFVKHNDDYTAFSGDLKTYCGSDSKKQNRILCNMIAYELKKACQFDKDGRPSPVIYSKKSTPKEICFSTTIQLTNQWIWNVLTNNGQKQIDVTAKELCDKVANDETTRQLARFFYRAAPHVRNSDLSTTSKDGTKSNLGKQTLTESISKTAAAITAAKDKTKTAIDGAKDDADQTIEKTKTLKQKFTDGVENVKNKLAEGGQVVKQKLEKTAEDAKEKVDKAISDVKGKTEDAAKTAKSKIDDAGGSRKEKADKTTEKPKQKADDNDDAENDADDKTKVKSDKDDNDDADKDKTVDTKKNVDEDADSKKDKLTNAKKLSKDAGDKVANASKTIVEKGKEFLNKLTKKNVTEIKATDDQGKVLDLKQDKKTDQNADEEEEKDDDGNGDGTVKDDGQVKQIPKPNTTDKKDDATNNVEVTTMQKEAGRTTVVVGVQSSNKTLEVTTPSQKKKPTDAVKDADTDQDDDDKDDETKHKVDDMDKKDQLGNNEPVSHDDYDAANTPADQNQLENVPNNNEDEEYQAGNKDADNDGISFRKPNANDKYTAKPVAADPNKGKARAKPQVGRKYSDDDGWSGSFVTYFLLFTLFVVVGYLVLHNKNKLMAYVLEGRRTSGSRTGSRPSHRGYEKLKNINDIIPIDDTNPVSDKEAVILKA
ncbi:unnamed protein product [Adineta ricciae]|uniref:Uncharacterized protein n=1 Tax=Adineta ricciae TaxID=249248 RepID=A0A815FL23_ADIRI|nr:unnamed protein product [Adineta ricciae]